MYITALLFNVRTHGRVWRVHGHSSHTLPDAIIKKILEPRKACTRRVRVCAPDCQATRKNRICIVFAVMLAGELCGSLWSSERRTWISMSILWQRAMSDAMTDADDYRTKSHGKTAVSKGLLCHWIVIIHRGKQIIMEHIPESMHK